MTVQLEPDPKRGQPITRRVLHIATVPFRPEEGVSRAVTALAGAMTRRAQAGAVHSSADAEPVSVTANAAAETITFEHHLVADRPVGREFVGHHELADWKPGHVLVSRELRSVVASVQPDIVHIHGGILAASLALAPALRRIPTVATIYQMLPVPRHELGLREFHDARRSSVRPARIVASALVGKPLVRRLLRSGTLAGVCTPDPRVWDALSSFGSVTMSRGGAEISDRRAIWSDQPVIGFAGRAEPGRGVEELVAAVAMLRETNPAVRLRLMLLPGPAASLWQETFGRESHIEVTVGIKADLSAELAACQVVALPFRIPATITPPLVASEAMAVGTPVVANRLSCITPLIVDGENGKLARNSSPAALAEAIGFVLKNETTWAKLSAGAHRSIRCDWSWDGAAHATRAAYEKVVVRGDLAAPRGPSGSVTRSFEVPRPTVVVEVRR